MKWVCSAAIAATLAFATQALAATPPASGAAAGTTGAAGAASAGAAGVNASATVGMTVKDNTGAAIGQIAAIAPDASGKSMATIKMGTQSFAVDASMLAVQGGAATVNATKAQIQAQLPKQ